MRPQTLDPIHNAATQANAYILHEQRANGSFPIVASTRTNQPTDAADLCIHAHLLDLLAVSLPNTCFTDAAQRTAQYIANALQAEQAKSAYNTIDTHSLFTALAALQAYDPQLVTPAMLAGAVDFLLSHEMHVGGPYYAAYVESSEDIHLAANIAISRFLHAIGGPFPNLTTFIAQNYHPGYTGPYYTEPWALERQLERTAVGGELRTSHTFASPFPARPAESAIGRQHPDGSWDRTFFYQDPATGTTYGCTSINTLLVLHTLLAPDLAATEQQTDDSRAASTRALQRAGSMLNYTQPNLRGIIRKTIARIAKVDGQHEISSLAWSFNTTLRQKSSAEETLLALDVANIYNWSAYTLYDTVLDTHSNVDLIPAANACLRLAIGQFYSALPNDAAYHRFIQHTYDVIDAANMWEVTHCRMPYTPGTVYVPPTLPSYGNLHSLYERSLSHMLPVTGTLLHAGFALDSPQVLYVHRAFKQYLIIRQLSDDLHDWKEDLESGQLSFVVTTLLRQAGITAGARRITPLIAHLEQVFWRETLSSVGALVFKHANTAERLLAASATTTEMNTVSSLVSGIVGMMRRTLRERDQAAALLTTSLGNGTSKPLV